MELDLTMALAVSSVTKAKWHSVMKRSRAAVADGSVTYVNKVAVHRVIIIDEAFLMQLWLNRCKEPAASSLLSSSTTTKPKFSHPK